MFLAWGAEVFLTAFVAQLLFVGEFGWDDGSRYAAFLQNLLMSGRFIAMVVGRHVTRGQTVVIAVGKWIGTLAPTIAFGVLGRRAFVLGVGVLCSMFDLAGIGGPGVDGRVSWEPTSRSCARSTPIEPERRGVVPRSRPSWRSQSRSSGDMTSAPAVGAGADAMDAWSATRLRTRAPPCCAAPAS